MNKLNPENQLPVNKEVLAKILDNYSITDFTYQPIERGMANTSLIVESNGKKYILRAYANQRKSNEEIAFEIEFQDYLLDHGIPIPKFYPNSEEKELTLVEHAGRTWQCVLIEFVEGQGVTTTPSKELLYDLAQYQAKMHLAGIEFAKSADKPKKLWIDLHDGLAGKITGVSDPEILAFLGRVKEYNYPLNPNLPYGYNHLDLDFDGNVLTKNNKITAILDFDDLEYSPIVVCLGYTLWNTVIEDGIEAMLYYLKEYEKIRLLSVEEREALPEVINFRNYVIGIIDLILNNNDRIEEILKLEKEMPAIREALK